MAKPYFVPSLLLSFALAAPLALQAAGELDPSFAPVPGITAEVAPTAEGKVLGLGDYDGSPDGSGVTLVRFAADGQIDPGFAAPFNEFNAAFRHFGVLSDGRIVVGGGIFRGQTASQTMTRLQPNGAFDPSFQLTAGVGQATMLALQPDGKIIVNGQNSSDSSLRSVFTRINADGSLDRAFDLPDSLISAIPTDFALQADGKLVIIGNFADLNGASYTSFATARLSAGGAYDAGFKRADAPDPTKKLTQTLAIQRDGKLLVSGGTYAPFPTIAAYLVRYNADGSLDAGFTPTLAPDPAASSQGTAVQAILEQRDGKIVIGGVFGRVNGTPGTNLARLNADGSLDATFHAPAEFQTASQARVIDVKEAADGKLLVAGQLYGVQAANGFTTVYGLVRLLNDDGGTVTPPPAKLPDLRAALSGAKVKVKADKTTLKATLVVRNAGKKKAKGITAAAYLSDDAGFDLTADQFLGAVDLGAASNLDKKASSAAILVKYKLPAGTSVTGKHLLVMVDPTGSIEESDETNNVASAGPLP